MNKSVTAEEATSDFFRFQRRLARRTFEFSVIIGVIVFAVGFKAVAKGLILGALFSVINFSMMAQVLPYQVGLNRRKATGLAFVSIFVRLGILAIPLIVALKSESFHWIAVAVGLFAVPIAIFIDQCIGQRFYKRGSNS